MPKNILTTNQYSKLVTDLNNLISQTKTKIETFARSQSLITYWEVGKRIVKEDLTNNANYFTLILEDLSGALEMDKNTLTRCVQFFKTYPVKPSVSNLTWSHYKNLISVNDSSLRLELEDRAKKLSWNVSQLSKVIQEAKTNNNKLNINSKIKRPLQPNYLYKATIVNVIDGDTLLLNVDLGFKVIKEQRVRLSQIDTAEMGTTSGQEAFKYLRDKAARLGTVVVKTNKIDIYGRYLVDIFYPVSKANNQTTQAEIFNQGVYLNEELVKKGFAKVV